MDCAWSGPASGLRRSQTRRSEARACTSNVTTRVAQHARQGQGGRCYTEKAAKAWHRQGTKQNPDHLQSTLTTVDRHNSPTKHRAPSKSNARVKLKSHNTHHHSNPGGKLPAGGMVGADAVGTVGGGGESGRAGAAHETGAVENAALRGAPGDAGCYRWCTKANCM